MRLVISTIGEITQAAFSLSKASLPRLLDCARSDIAYIMTMKVNNGILFTSVVKQVNAAAVGIGNTQYNSLYALGQAAREHCHAELVSASHLVRLLDTILSRSGAQASLEVT